MSYTAGEEQARTTVFTASPVRLVAISDRDTIRADDHDLAYITVTLRDDQGNIATHRDRLVHLQVGGAGARIKIESKDDMRKRGLPSPDRADAAAMIFTAAVVVVALGVWVAEQAPRETGVSAFRSRSGREAVLGFAFSFA